VVEGLKGGVGGYCFGGEGGREVQRCGGDGGNMGGGIDGV